VLLIFETETSILGFGGGFDYYVAYV